MYEWLKDYRKLNEEIAYIENNLERSKRELKRWVGGDLSKIKLEVDSDGAKLEDRIERIENLLQNKKNDLDLLIKLINTFTGLDNKILRMKYIENKTLEQIAEELNYSAGYIYKKHAEIMRTIKFAEKLNLNLQ